MKSLLLLTISLITAYSVYSQDDCPEAVPACTTPNFTVSGSGVGSIVDFTSYSISNPGSNPNPSPGNTGCLLSGETNSTFITINVVSSGNLEWSIQAGSAGCFDWIMWDYSAGNTTTCNSITGNTWPPVSCNWNSSCVGFTGMCIPGGLPPGGSQTEFENALVVQSGDQFLLCISNWSSTNQNVNLNFFGSAMVSCGVSAIDQTICSGDTASVTILTPGYTTPTFNWLVTTNVTNTSGGTNVGVYPTTTTTYQVVVHESALIIGPPVDDTATFTIFVEQIPMPYAGLDDTVCFGTPINLSGSISNSSNTKVWTTSHSISPTPTISFTPNFTNISPTVTVNQPGTYRFVLRETNSYCGIRRDTAIVFVKQMTNTPEITNTSCFGNDDGRIKNIGPDANQASYDGGQTWTSTLDSTGLLAGTYSICLRDANLCETCTTVTIAEGANLPLTVSLDTIICQNGTASLSAFVPAINGLAYNWSGGITATSSSVQINPTTGQYYTVFAQTATGCVSDLDSIYVDIFPPISAVFSGKDSICVGDESTINVTATGGNDGPYSFTWTNGSTGSGLTHQINNFPTTTSTYSVTIEDGCETSPLISNFKVEVLPLPIVNFTADTVAKCEPAVFSLSIVANPQSYINSLWSITDGQIINNLTTTNTVKMPAGTYGVELFLEDQFGCYNTLVRPNYLDVKRKPSAFAQYKPMDVRMFSPTVDMVNKSIGAISYTWLMPKAIPNYSTQSSPSVDYPKGVDGVYPVTLIAESQFNCLDTIQFSVEVLPELLLFAPNAFSPDGDQHNQTWGIVAKNIDETQFNLFIYDRWGGLIWESHNVNETWDGTYQGNVLPTGTYIWQLVAVEKSTRESIQASGNITILK